MRSTLVLALLLVTLVPVLPLVRITVACWMGDADFPSSYRVLFDAALARQLPTDAGAVLGSQITERLIAARRPDHPSGDTRRRR